MPMPEDPHPLPGETEEAYEARLAAFNGHLGGWWPAVYGAALLIAVLVIANLGG